MVKKIGNKAIGEFGEDYAEAYLKKQGYIILGRNFRKPFGEIDIIAKRGNDLIFVEVKTSIYYTNSSFSPEFRVNRDKLRKLRNICEFYLLENMFQSKQNWQVDVVSVLLFEDGNLKNINHFENVEFN